MLLKRMIYNNQSRSSRLKKEDVEIAISEDRVDICAEFKEVNIDEYVNYIYRERSYGK